MGLEVSRVHVSLPSLVHGISQLNAAERQPVHALASDDCWQDIAHGLQKRPPLIHVAKIFTGAFGNPYCHGIDRSSTERYLTLFRFGATTDNGLVCDLNGNVIPVFRNTGTYAAPVYDTCQYLYFATGTTPPSEIRALSVLDYTFLINRNAAVTMASTLSTAAPTNTAHVSIEQAAFAMGYTVKIKNGTGATWTIKAATHDSIVVGTQWTITSVAEGFDVFDLETPAPPNAAAKTSVKTQDIADMLAVKLNGGAAAGTYGTNQVTAGIFTVTRNAHVLKIVANNVGGGNTGVITLFEVTTSQGDNLAFGIQNETDSSANLPLIFTHNYVVKVKGNTLNDEDDFWVKFTGDNTAISTLQKGSWAEDIKPGIAFTWLYTPSSSHPHVLVRRTSDGINPAAVAAGSPFFSFEPINLGNRLVGDTTNNPNPSFVSVAGTYQPPGGGGTAFAFPVARKIQAMAFHRDRLIFAADNKVSCSEQASYFDFLRSTIQSLPDTDPIDATINSDKKIHAMIPHDGDLTVFSEDSEGRISGSPNLTPATIEAKVCSHYKSTPNCDPVAHKNGVLFTSKRGSYSDLRSLVPTPNSDSSFDADDLSLHVPSFIKGSVKQITVTPDSSIVAMIADGDPEAIYILKQHREGENVVQSAWGRFTVDAPVLGIRFFDQRLYVITKRGQPAPGVDTGVGDLVGWGLASCISVPALGVGQTYTYVSSTHLWTMAIRSDFAVVGWGIPNGMAAPVFTANPVSLSVGQSHAIAILADGNAQAWGANASGQCNVPALPGGMTYVQAAAGYGFSLLRRSDGNIVAFGLNTSLETTVPALAVGVTYTHIWAGYKAGMATTSQGFIVVWGNDSIAAPSPGSGLSFTRVAGSGSNTALNHYIGLLNDGTVACWGNNTWGQCTVPIGSPAFVEISGSFANSGGLTADGDIHIWGDDSQGQRTGVPAAPAGLAYSQIALGQTFAHGLLVDDGATGPSSPEGVFLEYIDLSPGVDDNGRDSWIYLDRRVNQASSGVSISVLAGVTTITMPYDMESDDIMEVVMVPTLARLIATQITSTTMTVATDLTGQTWVVGKRYTSIHRFHKPHVAIDARTGRRLVLDSTSAVVALELRYEDTMYFRVYTGSEYKQVGNTGLASITPSVSALEPDSGTVVVGVGGRLDTPFDVSIQNDSPFPHTIVTGEWILNATIRSRPL